jgi:serine/threonine protein kinase
MRDFPQSSLILADRYQLQERLNPHQSEGSRQTWLAEDLCDRKKVVVKLAPFKSGLNWADFKLFEREAAILGVLDHPRIPKYLDFLELDTPEYQGSVLVQEYIDARSFQAQVEAGQTFTCEMVKDIAIQILEILNYLHRLNPPVIHRDIKPSNLLLGNRSGHSVGQVYLVDFGAVQTIASAEYDTFTVVGTYGYMPFEQFGGQCVSASDLYSLGATLIYLLTGQHPADLPQVNGQLEFSNLIDLDWKFHQWLKQTIAPAANQRFSTAQEALVELQAIDLKNKLLPSFKSSKYSTIMMERSSDQFKLRIVRYKFIGTMTSKAISVFFLYLFPIVALTCYYSFIFSSAKSNSLGFFNLIVIVIPFVAYLAFCGGISNILEIPNENFVATLINEQQDLMFKFKVKVKVEFLHFLRREAFQIQDIYDIFKIEQVLDMNSNTTSLILWSGIRQHVLTLTEAEAHWVGKGISECLGVLFEQRRVTYLQPDEKSNKLS